MQLLIGHGQVPTIMPEASFIISHQRIKFKNIVFLILFLKESLYPIE